MFPRHSIRRLADELLLIVDAMLTPIDAATEAPELDDWAAPAERPHPHRRAARTARERRPRAGAPREQHCLSPVSQRARASTTAPLRSAP